MSAAGLRYVGECEDDEAETHEAHEPEDDVVGQELLYQWHRDAGNDQLSLSQC